jgi:hypothetical protein
MEQRRKVRVKIYAGTLAPQSCLQVGEMAEWTKAHDSKSCRRQRLGGSNPSLSVCKTTMEAAEAFFVLGLCP